MGEQECTWRAVRLGSRRRQRGAGWRRVVSEQSTQRTFLIVARRVQPQCKLCRVPEWARRQQVQVEEGRVLWAKARAGFLGWPRFQGESHP